MSGVHAGTGSSEQGKEPVSMLQKLSKIKRDTVLFAGGFMGVLHQTIFEQVDRPSLLIIFGGMMGLPVFLRKDDTKKEVSGDSDATA
jgi:folate-dependent phosphoribosylglycinamide formyltransferase PurN